MLDRAVNRGRSERLSLLLGVPATAYFDGSVVIDEWVILTPAQMRVLDAFFDLRPFTTAMKEKP